MTTQLGMLQIALACEEVCDQCKYMSNRHMQVLLLLYQQEDADTALNMSWRRARHDSEYDAHHFIAWYNASSNESSLHGMVRCHANVVVDA